MEASQDLRAMHNVAAEQELEAFIVERNYVDVGDIVYMAKKSTQLYEVVSVNIMNSKIRDLANKDDIEYEGKRQDLKRATPDAIVKWRHANKVI
jgi:hypothetical protein